MDKKEVDVFMEISKGNAKYLEDQLQNGLDVNKRNQSDEEEPTLLIHALINNQNACTKLLIDNKCDTNLLATGVDKFSPLDIAIIQENIFCLELLINSNCDINLETTNKFSPIQTAIMNNSFKIASILIEENCDLNLIDNNGYTLCDFCIETNRINYLYLIVTNGCEISELNKNSVELIEILQNLDRERTNLFEIIFTSKKKLSDLIVDIICKYCIR